MSKSRSIFEGKNIVRKDVGLMEKFELYPWERERNFPDQILDGHVFDAVFETKCVVNSNKE